MKLKISRLFHWLYATLMFLPILMFIPSCIYYGFNEHALAPTTQVANTIEVDFNQQIQETQRTIYANGTFFGSLSSLNNANIGDVLFIKYYQNGVVSTSTRNTLMLYYDTNSTQKQSESSNRNQAEGYYTWYLTASHDYYSLGYWVQGHSVEFSIYDIQFFNLTQMYGVGNEPTQQEFEDSFPNDYYAYTLSEFEFIPNGTYTDYIDITQSINLAWEQVWNLPVFSWTQNSFVTAPFSYITGLFGLSSDNSINYVFTYFVSISICWLVFDLIMYVPNLAHRWLDRSAIE